MVFFEANILIDTLPNMAPENGWSEVLVLGKIWEGVVICLRPILNTRISTWNSKQHGFHPLKHGSLGVPGTKNRAHLYLGSCVSTGICEGCIFQKWGAENGN